MNAFFEATLNGWWQGILLTLVVWLVLRDLPRISAATRLAIWHATLAVVLLLPALQRIPVAAIQRMVSSAAVREPERPVVHRGAEATLPVDAADPQSRYVPSAAPPPSRPAFELSNGDWITIVLSISIALAFLQLLRLLFGYWMVQRLKRKSKPAGIGMPVTLNRPVSVLSSDRVGMPMAVGYLRPAILLPRKLADRLTPGEMRHVLLHESAHLRRRDDWAALAERVIRAVFCFQPAVYWICNQIERERESACDDWVVAQGGAPKEYAGSLARLAELSAPSRAPILATGAGRPKEIFRRLESLLDRTRNRVPSVSEPLVMLAGLLLLVFVFEGTQFNHLFGLSNFTTHWRESDGTHRREMKMRGEVRFTPNDQDVESMSPDAMLVIEQSDGWQSRRVEFRPDEQGNVERRYFSNGAARPFDAEARRMLAGILPQWVREQGRDIPDRVTRMIQEKGADAALEDVRTIHNTSVKRQYLEELLAQAGFGAPQLGRVLKIAAEMESDNEKLQFLNNADRYYLDRGFDDRVLNFIDTVHSDGDRRQMLGHALDRGTVSDASLPRLLRSVARISSDNEKADLLRQVAQLTKTRLPEAFFDAAAGIHSDGDRAKLLLSLMDGAIDAQTLARILRTASSMSSDGEKANVVVQSARGFQGTAEVLPEASRVLRSIHSDGDRRRCLEALIDADGKNAETLRELLSQTAAISSDGDKSQVLIKAAGGVGEQEAVRRAFFSAVSSIHSSGDQRRVLMAVLTRPDLGAETLREVTRSAAQIASHEDQSAVLKAVAERQ